MSLAGAGVVLAASCDNDSHLGKNPVVCDGAAVTDAPSATAESGPTTSVYDIPIGSSMPNEVMCFIEVARGSRNKYEWDNDIGFLKLDRVLHSAVFYPHNYGFIPQTLCGDGDPLDVLVMGEHPLQPGCFLDIRPIGYMVMEDEKGVDEKVLAVSTQDPHFTEVHSLRDVPEHVLREIAHFFGTYKALEKKKWAKVGGWKGTEDTKKLIEDTHKSYLKAKAKGHVEFSHN
jgi:inorganic pyrophosphatase